MRAIPARQGRNFFGDHLVIRCYTFAECCCGLATTDGHLQRSQRHFRNLPVSEISHRHRPQGVFQKIEVAHAHSGTTVVDIGLNFDLTRDTVRRVAVICRHGY